MCTAHFKQRWRKEKITVPDPWDEIVYAIKQQGFNSELPGSKGKKGSMVTCISLHYLLK